MRRALLGLMLLVFFLLSTSFSWPFRPGLLTHDFGIVTQADIDQEAAIVRVPKSIEIPTFFSYWRCLRPNRIEMECEEVEEQESTENRIAAPQLTLIVNSEKYEYYTRRPWGLDACEETLASWRNVIGSEAVFCISATVDEVNESPTATPWTKITYGEINRMKSLSGKWSYFIDNDSDP